jgi:dimethylhistidine N-methyltransferase
MRPVVVVAGQSERPANDFRDDLLAGLTAPAKRIPCKYFYDERGSRLFDLICEVPEYYPTRAEMEILATRGREIAAAVGPDAALVEFGAGSARKVRLLLDRLCRPAAYVAIDISREHLLRAAGALARDYPRLPVAAVVADYMRPLELPDMVRRGGARPVVFFPGSTVGNLDPPEAVAFLRRVAEGTGGGLLIGVDLKKDAGILNAAYNDARGVTAAFNLNLLLRANREVGAGFDLRAFAHRAFYERDKGRIEMHLVSRRAQVVDIGGLGIRFSAGETIHTENSYKYAVDEFREMAGAAGWTPRAVWTDAGGLFSLHYLEAPPRPGWRGSR